MVQTGYELVLPCCWNWLWLVQTGFSLSLKLAQTGSSLFKLVFTSCECQEKMVQTGYELVLPYCWNWLWLAQTGSSWPKLFLTGYCEYQEKMVQTGSSLLLKLTVTKLVHTGSCAWQANTYLWRKMVEIGSSFLFKYNLMLTTGLAVTSSIWSSLCYTVALTSSNWFLLVVVHDKQIHIYGGSVFSTTSKESPSAFEILHGRPGRPQYDRCETEAHTKAWALHVVRELPPLQRVLIQHNCECEECEGSWSWV